MPVDAGQVLGTCCLVEKLGEGGFAEVWKARRTGGDTTLVALKVPRDADRFRALVREGVLGRAIRGPGIVEVLEVAADHDPPYLILELVEGGTLRDQLGEPMAWDRALGLLSGMLAGLATAHRRGVAHGDIKPENVLLTGAGEVKVADFGLAQASAEASLRLSCSMGTADGAGLCGGTVAYMAPEQLRGEPATLRSDVFSTGVIFFEMLCGRRPEGYEVPTDRVRGVPAIADDVFLRCYAPEAERFEDASRVIEALGSLVPGRRGKKPAGGRDPKGALRLIRDLAKSERSMAGREFFAMGDGRGRAEVRLDGLIHTLDLGGARVEGPCRVRALSSEEGRLVL